MCRGERDGDRERRRDGERERRRESEKGRRVSEGEGSDSGSERKREEIARVFACVCMLSSHHHTRKCTHALTHALTHARTHARTHTARVLSR